MPSFERAAALTSLALALGAARLARAQTAPLAHPSGFAVERLTTSAPGGGWFVMDTLDMPASLNAAAAALAGYSKNALRVADGSQHLDVVSDQVFTQFGFAAGIAGMRLSFVLDVPALAEGEAGSVGGFELTGPSFGLGTRPDTISDARLGFDARLVGDPESALRLGASAQVYIPSGDRGDYVTDGTYRAMLRVLVAGDEGAFTYAGHLGVHVRPVDDAPAPGSPRGSELLFGLAAGARCPLSSIGATLVVGPEVFGESAFHTLFGSSGTAVEGLFSTRAETSRGTGPRLEVKVAVGAGLDPTFGAPAWRWVLGFEVRDQLRTPP